MSDTQTIKNRINRTLSSIGTYHKEIPLDAIFAIVKSFSGDIVDVDGTLWNGILCGDNSSTRFTVRGFKFYLYLSWYKMQSGNYEITVYVS